MERAENVKEGAKTTRSIQSAQHDRPRGDDHRPPGAGHGTRFYDDFDTQRNSSEAVGPK